jgi:hypothetical protein
MGIGSLGNGHGDAPSGSVRERHGVRVTTVQGLTSPEGLPGRPGASVLAAGVAFSRASVRNLLGPDHAGCWLEGGLHRVRDVVGLAWKPGHLPTPLEVVVVDARRPRSDRGGTR